MGDYPGEAQNPATWEASYLMVSLRGFFADTWIASIRVGFLNVRPAIPVLRSVGIAPLSGMDRSGRPFLRLPIVCGIERSVVISSELFATYRQRGFSMTALCLAFADSGIHFDPATGQRLPLFSFSGEHALRPLWLPDCYKSAEVLPSRNIYTIWRPSGCILEYHPWTGKKISRPELLIGGRGQWARVRG